LFISRVKIFYGEKYSVTDGDFLYIIWTAVIYICCSRNILRFGFHS